MTKEEKTPLEIMRYVYGFYRSAALCGESIREELDTTMREMFDNAAAALSPSVPPQLPENWKDGLNEVLKKSWVNASVIGYVESQIVKPLLSSPSVPNPELVKKVFHDFWHFKYAELFNDEDELKEFDALNYEVVEKIFTLGVVAAKAGAVNQEPASPSVDAEEIKRLLEAMVSRFENNGKGYLKGEYLIDSAKKMIVRLSESSQVVAAEKENVTGRIKDKIRHLEVRLSWAEPQQEAELKLELDAYKSVLKWLSESVEVVPTEKKEEETTK